MPQTSQAMEVQITQEYLGQQRHLVYIAPMWKWVLDFDLEAGNKGPRDQGNEKTRERARATPVKEIIAGKSFDEATICQVAFAYEQTTPWHQQHPKFY